MKKIMTIVLIMSALIYSCYVFGNIYSFVDHKVYVYRHSGMAGIVFMDRHQSKYYCEVDSANYEAITAGQQKWFMLRHYDDGRNILLSAE